jgi:hypothetical protein
MGIRIVLPILARDCRSGRTLPLDARSMEKTGAVESNLNMRTRNDRSSRNDADSPFGLPDVRGNLRCVRSGTTKDAKSTKLECDGLTHLLMGSSR